MTADLGRLLSLEQEYVYPGPPPHAGETLQTAERLTDITVKQTRDGRAMVVDPVHRLVPRRARRPARGVPLHLGLRPAGAVMIEMKPGARLPERVFGPVTLTDIVRYQGASGDLNPIHHDDEFARAAGFPAAIGVGMLGAGWLAAYCTEHLGEENVRRFRTRFSSVVYRGDRLTASAEVVRLFDQDREARAELADPAAQGRRVNRHRRHRRVRA